MRSVPEAQQTVLSQEVSPREVVRSTEGAKGYVLAQTQKAREDSPRFRKAAMDGYAVRSADTNRDGTRDPTVLELDGDIPAGGNPDVGGGRPGRLEQVRATTCLRRSANDSSKSSSWCSSTCRASVITAQIRAARQCARPEPSTSEGRTGLCSSTRRPAGLADAHCRLSLQEALL